MQKRPMILRSLLIVATSYWRVGECPIMESVESYGEWEGVLLWGVGDPRRVSYYGEWETQGECSIMEGFYSF